MTQMISAYEPWLLHIICSCSFKITDVLLFPPAQIDPVPPNATVVFEVEVYSVSRGPRSMEAFGDMDLDKDRSLTKAEVTIIYKLVIIRKVAQTERELKGLIWRK